MRGALVLAIAAATVTAAQAQQPRSVQYFIMHNDARLQMEQYCSGGIASPLVNAECINAHQAGWWIAKAEAQHRVDQGRFGVGSMDSPLFYDANPWARWMTLNECVHPSAQPPPTAAMCQAARISAGRQGR